jgi:cation/acetate symporter
VTATKPIADSQMAGYFKMRRLNVLLWGGPLATANVFAADSTQVRADNRVLTFSVFTVLFALTMAITFMAAKRNASAKDFYTAGGGIGPRLNGLAIAGDYLSAAAFLEVSGLIALYGLDGYLVGFFISFIPVLILVAEPCRNPGKYTLGDVLAFRNSFRATKAVVAFSSVLVALFYMVPRIVAVGALMLTYVMFGGMRATTSVQVLKATLLISFCVVLVVMSWIPYGFDVESFFHGIITNDAIREHILNLVQGGKNSLSVSEAGQRFMEPGLCLKNPLEHISLGMALVLGTAAILTC